MSYVGNSPNKVVVFRVEARKSFSFAVRIRDSRGRQVDISGCELRIVAKQEPFPQDESDDSNLISNYVATVMDTLTGYARFDLQSTDLEVVGEHPFVIVLVTPDGYSSVIVKGHLDIQENTEFASLGDVYTSGEGATDRWLDVYLKDRSVIKVEIGSQLPPDAVYFAVSDKQTLDQLTNMFLGPDAVAQIPPGGLKGRVLGKKSASDYDIGWLNVGSGGGGGGGDIDATDVPAGWVPMADGLNLWDWHSIESDTVTEGSTHLFMTQEERDKLAELPINADWDATEGPALILNKPDVVPADHNHRLIELLGVARGFELPTGGVDGDVYLMIEEPVD